MIKKIVVIISTPFSQRYYNRYGIEILRNNGLEVEIWDVTSACLCKEIVDILVKEDTSKYIGFRIFKEKSEIVKAISFLEDRCLIHAAFDYSPKYLFIWRAISKQQIKYLVTRLELVPDHDPPLHKSFISCIVTILKKDDLLKRIVWYIHDRILLDNVNRILLKYYYLFGIPPASIILLSSERSSESLELVFPVNKTTKLLWTHAWDYDSYLQHKTELSDSCKMTGVFLDENTPFDPASQFGGIPPLPPDIYYPKICNFFKLLEKNMKTEIVIAAHPTSDYDNLPDYFCGRTVIKGETLRLVKESSFVIAQSSSSIKFAVLTEKPIFFLIMDDQVSDQNITGLYISTVASELGKKPILIDHLSGFNWEKEMEINKEAYLRYRNLYIKKQGTPEKPVWEIFCSYIQQNYIS